MGWIAPTRSPSCGRRSSHDHTGIFHTGQREQTALQLHQDHGVEISPRADLAFGDTHEMPPNAFSIPTPQASRSSSRLNQPAN